MVNRLSEDRIPSIEHKDTRRKYPENTISVDVTGHCPAGDLGRLRQFRRTRRLRGRPPSTGSGTSENAPTDDTPGQSDEFLGLFNTNATLLKTVLMDESGVKITATGLPYTAYSVDLQLTIENNSGKALTIGEAYGSLSVNGFMTDYSYCSQKLGDG